MFGDVTGTNVPQGEMKALLEISWLGTGEITAPECGAAGRSIVEERS